MRTLTFILLLITGLALAVPGLYLATLGGSLYYVIVGILILASAFLVRRGSASGIVLYWLALLLTLVWSLWEVGVDGWALMPRLVFLSAGALWLLWFAPSRLPAARRLLVSLLLVAGLAGLLGYSFIGRSSTGQSVSAAMTAQMIPRPVHSEAIGDWPHYGNSLHATRYSDLAQITSANAATLKQAWVYHANLFSSGEHPGQLYEDTPLMVDGLLYGCTGHSAVFALDPVTGKQVWRHETRTDPSYRGRAVCRGVAFFRAPQDVTECPTRILAGTVDNHLIALDARTGAPCRDFGHDGVVDLSEGEGLNKFPHGWINPTSPPTIVHGVAVIGAYIIDDQSTFVPPGVVRGYDAVTGKLKWVFDPGRPDDHAPPGPGQTYTPSTPNAWPVFSADDALGLVYLPMGMGSPDFYGVNRTPQTNRFSTAVVALDADTGAVRWVYQTVHHDLWDYDNAAQPVLADVSTATGKVPALIEATKTGQIFVLDRRTGKPLTEVEERPVPASTIPGERASRTQPFSVGMPSFAGPILTEADMWGITPFDQLYCRIRFRQADYHGYYTPPRLGASIRSPGELGGIDWGGVSLDEARGILVVNSNLMADYDRFIPRAEADAEGLYLMGDPHRSKTVHGAAMAGTPYGVQWGAFLSPLGIPCQRPPYGFLTAVDLRSHKILWQHVFGDASNSGPFGIALGLKLPLGAPNIGGSLVTRGGVIFIGASQDQKFRAVDEATGRVLWQVRLPAGGHATPMTYRGRDGRQYVLIVAGGQPAFGTGSGDSFIAYRLGS